MRILRSECAAVLFLKREAREKYFFETISPGAYIVCAFSRNSKSFTVNVVNGNPVKNRNAEIDDC